MHAIGRSCAAFIAGLIVMSMTVVAVARPLEAVPSGKQKIRVDGLLREWPANMDPLSTNLTGRGEKVTGVVGYDDRNVYVAMKVRDKKLVRTKAFGSKEDHGELVIGFPSGTRIKTYRIGLYPGVSGKSPGLVKMSGGSKIAGAKIVEAPEPNGYAFEASIPWKTFPEAKRIRVGLRGALRYTDSDAPGRVSSVVATSGSTQGTSLPPLLLEAEQGLFHSLVHDKHLPEIPRRSAAGDIAGDDEYEYAAIYGGYLTLVGGAYRGGKEFFFQDMGVARKDAVRRFELKDLTGDGKSEIILEKRVGDADAYRQVLEVLSVSAGGDEPFVAFRHETAVATKDGRIENEVSFPKKGKSYAIRISQGKHKGFDPETYEEPVPDNMDGTLLPWQSVKSETYAWDGKGFEKSDEEKWDPPVKGPARVAPRRTRASAAGPANSDLPPAPRPPSAEEMLDRVYALYRRERGVGKARPRFDFVTDVAGDRTNERVLVHGKDVVVFGKAFKEGASYAFITVGVDEPKDIVSVSARDLSGDGKAEVLVRGIIHAKASKQLGGGVVDRHALFIYQVSEGGLERIFAAETGRSVDDSSIIAGIRFLPQRRGIDIELRPGRAVGWTEKTYPFPIDRAPYGGLEPLLVPWGDEGPKRYHFNGDRFVEQ